MPSVNNSFFQILSYIFFVATAIMPHDSHIPQSSQPKISHQNKKTAEKDIRSFHSLKFDHLFMLDLYCSIPPVQFLQKMEKLSKKSKNAYKTLVYMYISMFILFGICVRNFKNPTKIALPSLEARYLEAVRLTEGINNGTHRRSPRRPNAQANLFENIRHSFFKDIFNILNNTLLPNIQGGILPLEVDSIENLLSSGTVTPFVPLSPIPELSPLPETPPPFIPIGKC